MKPVLFKKIPNSRCVYCLIVCRLGLDIVTFLRVALSVTMLTTSMNLFLGPFVALEKQVPQPVQAEMRIVCTTAFLCV